MSHTKTATAVRRCTCQGCLALEFLGIESMDWAVMSTRGILAWLESQEAAEKEAALCRKHEPDLLIWVAPWPAVLAAVNPQAPWTNIPDRR
jgi:hypothetical protein